MVEIVFSESACGSLKIAQTYGKGKYRGSAVSIFMRHEDGSVPSSDEIEKGTASSTGTRTHCLGECYSIGRQEQ